MSSNTTLTILVIPTCRLAGNQVYTLCSMMAHNLSREIQKITAPIALRALPKRPAAWRFKSLNTLRHRYSTRWTSHTAARRTHSIHGCKQCGPPWRTIKLLSYHSGKAQLGVNCWVMHKFWASAQLHRFPAESFASDAVQRTTSSMTK